MYRNTRYWQYIRASLSLWRTTCMYRNTRYWQYIRASLSRYDVQHAWAETIDSDNIFGPLSLSHNDVQHACKETLDRDNIFMALSLSLWRTTCMYRNNRYWLYIRASLSLFLSFVMTYNIHVQKHSILTIYSGLPLSHYDVQHACTGTLNTDTIFGPISLSLVMTYNMHVEKHSILTIYSGLSLSLSLWRTTCMYTNTEYWKFIRASLSLSLWRTTCMYRNSQHRHYIRAYLSISRYDVQHACTETLDTDNKFRYLSLSLWRRICM